MPKAKTALWPQNWARLPEDQSVNLTHGTTHPHDPQDVCLTSNDLSNIQQRVLRKWLKNIA